MIELSPEEKALADTINAQLQGHEIDDAAMALVAVLVTLPVEYAPSAAEGMAAASQVAGTIEKSVCHHLNQRGARCPVPEGSRLQ